MTSFIDVFYRVNSWGLLRSLNNHGWWLCQAEAESVFKERSFHRVPRVRFTKPESSLYPLGLFDLWERFVRACEDIVGHLFVRKIGAEKLLVYIHASAQMRKIQLIAIYLKGWRNLALGRRSLPAKPFLWSFQSHPRSLCRAILVVFAKPVLVGAILVTPLSQ